MTEKLAVHHEAVERFLAFGGLALLSHAREDVGADDVCAADPLSGVTHDAYLPAAGRGPWPAVLLINGDAGWVPGNVFATIEEGLAEMAEAAQDLWLRGVEGETLSFRRTD